MSNNKAFTVAESVIAITLLGFLFAITAINTKGLMADSNVARFKKSYSLLESATGNLIHNKGVYGGSGGFKDTDTVIVENVGEIIGQNPSSKFRDAFKYYLSSVKDNIPCQLYKGTSSTGCFQTDEGIVWGIPDTDFVDLNTMTIKDEDNDDIIVVPITIYLNYENDQTLSESAYIATITYNGKISILKNNSCDSKSRAVECNIEKYIKSNTIKYIEESESQQSSEENEESND